MADDAKLKPKPVVAAIKAKTVAAAEATGLSPVQGHGCSRRRRLLLRACCGLAVLAAVLAVATLVLSFTVLKVRDPTMSMSSISVEWFSIKVDENASRPMLINVTLVGDIVIRNPNLESMRFGVSTTEIYIDGVRGAVGVGRGSPGVVAARGTSRMRAAVDVFFDRLTPAMVTRVLFGTGEVRLASRTVVSGRVSMLGGLYGRRQATVAMRCGVTLHVSLAAAAAGSPACVADFGH